MNRSSLVPAALLLAALGSCAGPRERELEVIEERGSARIDAQRDLLEWRWIVHGRDAQPRAAEAPASTSKRYVLPSGDLESYKLDRQSTWSLPDDLWFADGEPARPANPIPVHQLQLAREEVDGTLTLLHKFEVPLSRVVDAANTLIRESLLEPDARADLEREVVWIDAATRELWIEKAQRGEAWIRFESRALELRCPIAAQADPRACVEGARRDSERVARFFGTTAEARIEGDELAILLARSSTDPPESARATPDRTPLVVASDIDNRPFAWLDEHGTPRGRDVEMMQSLARELGRELEWRRMPFAELLPAAESGTVDVVCATLGVTPERAERVLFTRPYFTTEIAVVVRAGLDEPSALDELAGARIVASRGTTSERAVRTYAPRAIYAPGADSDRAASERLSARDVDAIALDGPAADALVALSSGAFVRLGEALCSEHYALALPKDRASLRDELDLALARMEASGELARLDAEYGLVRSE